jgi:hypothetical protein
MLLNEIKPSLFGLQQSHQVVINLLYQMESPPPPPRYQHTTFYWFSPGSEDRAYNHPVLAEQSVNDFFWCQQTGVNNFSWCQQKSLQIISLVQETSCQMISSGTNRKLSRLFPLMPADRSQFDTVCDGAGFKNKLIGVMVYF